MTRFTALASCGRTIAMTAAVPLPIARTPFHNTHGAFFLILIFTT